MRVCDPCFDLYGPKEEAGARPPAQQQKKKTEGDLPAEYLASALSKQVCILIIYGKKLKIIFWLKVAKKQACCRSQHILGLDKIWKKSDL